MATAVTPLLLRLLARTWALRVVNRRPLDEIILPGKPVVVATWHQMFLAGLAYFRDLGAIIMISRSRDGELIDRVNRRMGFRSVRGSSSRGGGEALHELVDQVRNGAQAAIMVDGPRGPARDPKPGIVLAAARSGAPIVPVACRARPGWTAGSWDRTLIPLPFACVVMSFGDPIAVPPGLSPADFEGVRLRVRDALLKAEARAGRALEFDRL
jgi:hypothetical protein